MLGIFVSSLALSPGAPKLGEHRLAARATAARAALSLGPAFTVAALPVHAEPLPALAALDVQQLPMTLIAEDGGIFGLVATVIVAGLGLFVLNFIKDAALEYASARTPQREGYQVSTLTRAPSRAAPLRRVGSQVPERGNRIKEQTGGGDATPKGSYMYDDYGTGAAARSETARRGGLRRLESAVRLQSSLG